MDNEFEKRWRAGDDPFDGVTVYLEDFVPLADLCQMLIPLIQLLSAHCPEARMFRMEDWHEHDNYISRAMPASWQELRSLLESEDALRRASGRADYVRTAFFPEGREFLLRLYVPDIDDNPHLGHYGAFDVTSHEPLALEARNAALEAGAMVQTMAAKAFFDRQYCSITPGSVPKHRLPANPTAPED